MNTISRILGEATRPPTESELTDPRLAYQYARHVLKGRFPEGEAAIATDPHYALLYASHVIKGRWPEGEEAMATNADSAYWYAKDFIKGRWPEGEEAIVKSGDPRHSKQYLQLFPEAKMDWFANRWIDWTQL